MGWDFGWDTRAELVAHIVKGWAEQYNGDTIKHTCLAHTFRGFTLWSVWEVTHTNGKPTHRFIGCDLIRGRTGSRDGWGRKAMSEEMGPYDYTCPLDYLDMVPEVADADWRAKVHAYHAQQKRTFAVGQTVELVNCSIPQVRIVSVKPLLGVYNGTRYRLPKKYLGNVKTA